MELLFDKDISIENKIQEYKNFFNGGYEYDN